MNTPGAEGGLENYNAGHDLPTLQDARVLLARHLPVRLADVRAQLVALVVHWPNDAHRLSTPNIARHSFVCSIHSNINASNQSVNTISIDGS